MAVTTGWPPGLLQDDSRKLSDWFASRIDAKHTVRKVCAEIERKRMSEIKCTRCGQDGHLPVECKWPVLPDDRVLKDTPEKAEVLAVNLKAMTLRTWSHGTRCAECCNGDRCDDPTHYSRDNCPHCKGTGWAIWTEAGRADFVDNLVRRGLGQQEAQQRLNLVLQKD